VIDRSQLARSEKGLSEPSEEAIGLRSRQIWEREGRPDGCAHEHWLRAKNELEAEQEHWLRAKAELEAQIEKTSNAHLAAPMLPGTDFVRSVLDRADAIIAKTPRPAARSKSDGLVLARPRSLFLTPAKRVKQTTAAPSIISADVVLHGALESAGEIQLDGQVDGKVRSTVLVVGDEATIQGDVVADDVTVRGSVRGSIRARKVLLCSGSRVEGDIFYETFVAEAGAKFDGTCRQADDPLSLELVPEEPVEAETPAKARRSQSAA
jgi:cytoskeletal protein CcmA (bactofilin family)